METDSLKRKCDELIKEAISSGTEANYTHIINLCDGILESDSQNSTALIHKGYALAFLEQFESAITCYDEILKRDLNNSNALHAKSLALNRLGKYEHAIECSDNILRLDNGNIHALNNKGFALGRMGRYEEAIECCNIVLATKSDDKDTLELIKWINEESNKIKN